MSDKRMRVAHISTFPPLRCGIASFAADLISALPDIEHECYGLHYGDQQFTDVCANADVNSEAEVAELADRVSSGGCDIVSLQHEFGIWGGSDGEYIHRFLDRLNKPLLSVLHTTFAPDVRNPAQEGIIRRLVERSAVIVALTPESKQATEILCGKWLHHAVIVAHGVPDVPYAAPPATWDELRPLRLITPGFFRPDKGTEIVLHALRQLRDDGYNIEYCLAGEPQHQFGTQASYLARIKGLIVALDLESVVTIDNRYLSVAEQITAIQEAHAGIFAYQEPSQSSSGTVPLVMCTGRPVLCTPFEYARAKAAENDGVFLSPGFDVDSIADMIKRFMQTNGYVTRAEETYADTRSWVWERTGAAFLSYYRAALAL